MLTRDDFADLMDKPFFGEVGYAEDIPELLECPCNCQGCMRVYEEAVAKELDDSLTNDPSAIL